MVMDSSIDLLSLSFIFGLHGKAYVPKRLMGIIAEELAI
jgi:hypothetical protein